MFNHSVNCVRGVTLRGPDANWFILMSRGIEISTGNRNNNKARKWLNQDSLLSLYYSFIFPYFIHRNHVWGTTYKTYIEPLTVLQKKINRIIPGVKPRTFTGPLFDRLKCLSCTNINKYLIGRRMFKIHNDEAHMFRTFFTKNDEIHTHDTRQKKPLSYPTI